MHSSYSFDRIPRAKSTHSRPSKPQTRTLRADMSSTNSVYKMHSDTSITNGIRNLSIRTHSAGSSKRIHNRYSGFNTLEDIAQNILSNHAKNIVVMAGAGISTSSGIPDFRSPGTGVYDNLQRYRIPYPQAIFDIDYFENHPKPFYTLAKELYPSGKYRPNYVHYFLRLLHEKGLLLRLYTQNIDGLERMAGIPAVKLVEAHGTFLTASCIVCKTQHPHSEIKESIFNSKLPRCKRSCCLGMVKPDIVFFGEDLPRRFYHYMQDFPQADLILVLGTSLQVEPFASIVDSGRIYVPRVLFNRHAVGPFCKKRRMNDVFAQGDWTYVTGDIVERVQAFVALLGWKAELQEMMEREMEALDKKYGSIDECISNAINDVEETIILDDKSSSGVSSKSSSATGSQESSVQDDRESVQSETPSSSSVTTSSSSEASQTGKKRKPSKKRKSPRHHGIKTRSKTTPQRLFHPSTRTNSIQRAKIGHSDRTVPQATTRPPVERPPFIRPVGKRGQTISAHANLESGKIYRLAQQNRNSSTTPKETTKFLPKIAYRHRSNGVVNTGAWRSTKAESSESEESSDDTSSDDD